MSIETVLVVALTTLVELLAVGGILPAVRLWRERCSPRRRAGGAMGAAPIR